jgi:hypothetical protein
VTLLLVAIQSSGTFSPVVSLCVAFPMQYDWNRILPIPNHSLNVRASGRQRARPCECLGAALRNPSDPLELSHRMWIVRDLPDDFPCPRIILEAHVDQFNDLLHGKVQTELAVHPQIAHVSQVGL